MKTARRSMLTLAVMAIAMAPVTASAQTRTLMKVPDISGSSIFPEHIGWIDVLSLRQAYPAAATSKQNPCQTEVVKGLDIAGPLLWAAAVNGTPMSEIQIEVWTPASGSWRRLYEIHLERPQITNIATSGQPLGLVDGGGGGATVFAETVTVSAAKVTLYFYPTNSDGSAGPRVTSAFACPIRP